MSGKGVKRASPGADERKNPLGDVELSDEDAKKLQEVQKSIARTELILERTAQEKLRPVYEKRREVLKEIPKFWPVALMNSEIFSFHAVHQDDQHALSYLEDLWIVREPAESRAFTLEFHFKENPYFSNAVLKKEYKFIPPPAAADEKPDADGVTQSMLEFSWERDVEAKAFKIDWKDGSKNLVKQYPRANDTEVEDMPSEGGSFFNFFEVAEDPFDLGVLIANDIFPEAIEYFLGQRSGDDDSEEDDEDDDDEDEDEIDLEKPRPKKARRH
ncbi:hypothetical protein EIP86_000140 [Pleurotus ostreatoroseus]|nr:hypothetical protein EIP86_000140 [Pleurotus ostreatoroseus]